MNRPWIEQVAIITGGASGIGLAVAQKLHSLGVKIALFDRSPEGLKSARETLGGSTLTVEANISEASSVESAVKQVMDRFGRIDILFNSAGIAGKTNIKAHEVSVEDFDAVYAVNLRGSFLICKAVLPHMLAANYGRICLVASIAGKEGNAGMTAYSCTKAGVIGLTKSLGKDYAQTGITINALAPAVIQTPLVASLAQETIDYMTSKIPMGRCGTLEEIAATSTFILSPENSFTTGFTFDLSGGRATY